MNLESFLPTRGIVYFKFTLFDVDVKENQYNLIFLSVINLIEEAEET